MENLIEMNHRYGLTHDMRNTLESVNMMEEGKGANSIEVKGLNLWYGEKQALHDIHMNIRQNSITALIGPSGCGKSTLLRTFNRMNDLYDCKVDGSVCMRGNDILDKDMDVLALRKKVGLIFQKPNPFPMSIRENVAYGPKIHGVKAKGELDEIVETSLKKAALWDEVSDRLDAPALSLSGGQQQRLCIARALAINPEIILMDEPTSALDPIASSKIEDLVLELKKSYTVVMVTHNMQQAARVSDYTGFMYLGRLEEFDSTHSIFNSPKSELTKEYVSGIFG